MALTDLYNAADAMIECGDETVEGVIEPDILTADDIEGELSLEVESAVSFMHSELAPQWERAQKYYNGETDLPTQKGRSRIVSTQVRDAIRAARPSLLRIFLHADTIVEFLPSHSIHGALAHQQSVYANQLFFRSGGYRVLYDAFQNSMLKKLAVIKWWLDEVPETELLSFSNVSAEEAEMISQREDVNILEANEVIDPATGVPVYDMKLSHTIMHKRIRIGNVPLHEFFIDEGASSFDDFRVCGHRRSVPIYEALALGLPMDLLEDLDDEDPEEDGSSESFERRGYMKNRDAPTVDTTRKKILLTEAYARYDLRGDGTPQLYRFYLGGTGYRMLAHEEVSEVPMADLPLDPEPSAFFGKSLFDVTASDQDTMTSLYRATADNAHLSNNRRLIVTDTIVNMDDVLNPAVGAPIRARAPGHVQEVGVQSTVGAMLPLLTHLQETVERKTGVTNAATGLDPDALQSTNVEAVKNTIALSQGQIEVMARNIAEGLQRVFRGILRLSVRHLNPMQMMEMQGNVIPINQLRFDPELVMQPKVGMGSGDIDTKRAGLMLAYEKQKEILATLGPMNPLVGLTEVYNTLEDLVQTFGMHNTARYFKAVTPEVEAQYAQAQAEAAANEPKPVDPGMALIESERLKAEQRREEAILQALLEQRQKSIEQQADALRYAADDDFKRDKLFQDLKIANAQIRKDAAKVREVKAEQDKPREAPYTMPDTSLNVEGL